MYFDDFAHKRPIHLQRQLRPQAGSMITGEPLYVDLWRTESEMTMASFTFLEEFAGNTNNWVKSVWPVFPPKRSWSFFAFWPHQYPAKITQTRHSADSAAFSSPLSSAISSWSLSCCLTDLGMSQNHSAGRSTMEAWGIGEIDSTNYIYIYILCINIYIYIYTYIVYIVYIVCIYIVPRYYSFVACLMEYVLIRVNGYFDICCGKPKARQLSRNLPEACPANGFCYIYPLVN